MPTEKRSSLFFIVLIVLGLVLGLGLATVVVWSAIHAPLSSVFQLGFVISLAGMFGGFLHGIRDRQLVLPHRNKNGTVNPGWIADCLFGVVGAWVVFLIIPGKFELTDGWEFIKMLATSAIGGYGGQAIIAKALDDTLKKLENRIEETIEENKDQQEVDAKALALVGRHLDKAVTTSDINVAELKETVKEASPSVKVQIFYMAHDLRSENWQSNKSLMERTIPIFEALIESDIAGQFHRNYGQLGYIFKDKDNPDYIRARASLTKAIELRGKRDPATFRLYEFNRAICNIMLDPNFTAEKKSDKTIEELILADLKVAMEESKTRSAIATSIRDVEVLEEIKKNPIGKWIKLNDLTLDDLLRKE